MPFPKFSSVFVYFVLKRLLLPSAEGPETAHDEAIRPRYDETDIQKAPAAARFCAACLRFKMGANPSFYKVKAFTP